MNATLQLGSSIYLWLTIDSAKIPVDSTLLVSDTIPEIMPMTVRISLC